MNDWRNRIVGLEHVDPKTLIFNPLNYKEHPELQSRMMSGTLDELGWIGAVLANKNTRNVIDGHMRLQLALDRREETIPVLWVDLDEEEEAKALASYDPIALFSKPERDKLADIVRSVQAHSVDMQELIEKIAKKNKISLTPEDPLEKESKEEKQEREQEEREKLVEKWEVEPGQIWRVPSAVAEDRYHRIICGDSGSADTVESLMDGDTGTLMVTDPPYGVDFENKFNPKSKDWLKIEGDEKKGDELQEWLADMLVTWMRCMEEDSAYYLWTAVFEEGFAAYRAIHDAGLHVQSQIVWSKNVFSLGQTDYHWQHELCWYAFKLGSKHRWYGGRDQSTVWSVNRVPNQLYIHPMQKPIELYTIPMKNHTKAGFICVDPFLGCGTQIVAAEKMGRICYGSELDPIWVAATLQRLSDLGMKPERVE